MAIADSPDLLAPDCRCAKFDEQAQFGVLDDSAPRAPDRVRRLKTRTESWHAGRVKPTAIQRWARLERAKKVLLVEAAAAVCAASLAVRLLPFKWAVGLSCRPEGKSNPLPDALLTDVQWSVDAATRHLPWNPVCIQRGLAAQWMLRRRGIDARLHYGLTNDSEALLKAHVWVDALGKTIVGGDEAGDYVRVATFP